MERLGPLIDAAHRACAGMTAGKLADYIPELTRVDPGRFGLAACDLSGAIHATGDADHPFTLQSASKPFVYGWALERFGAEDVHSRVGVEPTGDTFDSVIRLEESTNRPHNPMINAGAIAVSARFVEAEIPAADLVEKLGRFAGRDLPGVDEAVFRSEWDTGHRNLAMAYLMRHFGILRTTAEAALGFYVRQCAVQATCRDLSVMAATLAGGGVNPVTGERVLADRDAAHVLAVMSTCGMYDSSGRFAFEVGLPAKGGVSGALLVVAPGRFGLAAFSPLIDAHGNSIRGLAAARSICHDVDAHAFRCVPRRGPRPAAEEAKLPEAVAEAVAKAHAAGAPGAGAPGTAASAGAAATAPASAPPLAVAVCTVHGQEITAGETDPSFSLQAVGNAFLYALASETHGPEAIHRRCGMEPSGNPFNAIVFDPRTGRPANPLGNAGAMLMASLLPGGSREEREDRLLTFLGDLAGSGAREIDEIVLRQERASGDRNRAIASLLRSRGLLPDPSAALDLYWRACSVRADVRDLARMAATLAACGKQPLTGKTVLRPPTVRDTLTLMYVCGHHDESGRVAFDVGLPAKSGISGAIVAVVPGRMGIAVYSPEVNPHGSSVRGLEALRELSTRLHLGVFAGISLPGA